MPGAFPAVRHSTMTPAASPIPRYRSIGSHYRQRFGCKVYKVGVSVAQTCPNRQGLRGMQVCTFCDEWGSAAYEDTAAQSLAEQIRINGDRVRRRYKADKLLVYFQAYTHTFARITQLERWFTEALAQPGVAGIVVGTRPDCLSPRVLRMLSDLARNTYVSVELGVQTLDDDQLNFLSRGHDGAASLRALESLAAHPDIESCVHLMFGLPGESEDQLMDTARTLTGLGVHGVKLHNLHVLKNTPLERLHREGRFHPIGLEDYARRVRIFLEHLSPRVAVHRLSAVASRWEDVIAPEWVKEKMRPMQAILGELERWDSWQGKHYRNEGFRPVERAETPPDGPVETLPKGKAAGPDREWKGVASWA